MYYKVATKETQTGWDKYQNTHCKKSAYMILKAGQLSPDSTQLTVWRGKGWSCYPKQTITVFKQALAFWMTESGSSILPNVIVLTWNQLLMDFNYIYKTPSQQQTDHCLAEQLETVD